MYNHHVTPLLPTKFYLPPIPAGYVVRPHLVEKMDDALDCRLTLVSAPAGAGKTTLVSAWASALRKQGGVVGWYALDALDNAPARFLEHLVACLEECGMVIAMDSPASSPVDTVNSHAVLDAVICSLLNIKRGLLLILDDYHQIQEKEVHAALAYLLDHMPPYLHLVLLTRSDPPFGLARLRAAGQLLELRMDQLRFSAPEAAAFVHKTAGVQLTDSDAAALNTRTEGWIAGLQMAAISMRGRRDVPAFIAAFTGSHRFVFDYLLEQVLDQQNKLQREFLLKTSILERLSAPLCDAVAETNGAARELLAALERSNLFLTPLDDERIWYRYHPLFADLLQLVLAQTHPELVAELNQRACTWHEAQGDIPQALHYALACGDMQLVAGLVSANVLALVEQAELPPILTRLEALPRQAREPLPWLGVAHAWALAYTGQMAQAGVSLTLAERHLEVLPLHEGDRIRGHIAAVRAYLAWIQGSQADAVELAKTAERLLPPGEVALRALNLTTLGNALTQYQADPEAVAVLEEAAALSRQMRQSHVFMLAASALAYAYAHLGKLHKAHAVCQDAVELAEAHQLRYGRPLTAAACLYAELASILDEWGNIGAAIQAARKGLALSELWGQADTIMVCLIQLIEGLSYAGDTSAAVQGLQRACKLAHQVSPWFVQIVDLYEVRIWLDVNDAPQAARAAREAAGPFPVSVQARLLLQQNRLDEAITLLERTLPDALQSLSFETVRLGVIQAMAYFQKKDENRALAALKWALEQGQAENRVMTFVREGETVERLLRLALRKSICPQFTRRLLSIIEQRRTPQAVPTADALFEALSERELEVLRLLNGPLSTPEMAALLVVSTNTVRTHIKNIYGKLGVHGRSGAVYRARELGLLG
jgi:LuxR family maltose regulon positive regulatory protein